LKVSLLEKTEDTLILLIQDANPGFINSLRRIILSETPVMAIHEVVILENQSPLFDETIAHRLSLVPLRTNLERYSLPEDCECKGVGCNLCQVGFTLEVEAPEEGYVATTGDLKPQDPDIVPVSNDIPIAKLAKGQRIVVEAFARLGIGREHAKWQPVSSVAYKMVPKVKVDPTKCDGCEECIKVCFKQVFEIQDGKAVVVRENECTLCNLCTKECVGQAITIDYDKTSFIFVLESTGALPPDAIFEKGLDVFKQKLEHLIAQFPGRKRKTTSKRKSRK
jgi:DNA-directed RNA polymerase subunit D